MQMERLICQKCLGIKLKFGILNFSTLKSLLTKKIKQFKAN